MNYQYNGQNIVKITHISGAFYNIKYNIDGKVIDSAATIELFARYGIYSLTPRGHTITVSLLADKNVMIKFSHCIDMANVVDLLKFVMGHTIKLHNEYIIFNKLVSHIEGTIKDPLDLLLTLRLDTLHCHVMTKTHTGIGARIKHISGISKLNGKIIHLFLKIGVLKYDPDYTPKLGHNPSRHRIYRTKND